MLNFYHALSKSDQTLEHCPFQNTEEQKTTTKMLSILVWLENQQGGVKGWVDIFQSQARILQITSS